MREFVPRVDLVRSLHAQFIENERESEYYEAPHRGHRLWPTEASVLWHAPDGTPILEGACRRKVVYRLRDTPRERTIKPELTLKWRCGDWFEEHCLKASRARGDLARAKVRIFDTSTCSLPISGEIDAVNWINIDDETIYYPVDYKTAGEYWASSEILGNKSKLGKPKVENLLQLMVYLDHDPRFPWGLLVYGIRDGWGMAQFQVELVNNPTNGTRCAKVNGVLYPQYTMESIIERYRQICLYMDQNLLPIRDFDLHYTPQRAKALFDLGRLAKGKWENIQKGERFYKNVPIGDWQCSYCDYAQRCKEDGPGVEVCSEEKQSDLLEQLHLMVQQQDPPPSS